MARATATTPAPITYGHGVCQNDFFAFGVVPTARAAAFGASRIDAATMASFLIDAIAIASRPAAFAERFSFTATGLACAVVSVIVGLKDCANAGDANRNMTVTNEATIRTMAPY